MKEQLLHQLAYEFWANIRIIDALEPLTSPPDRAVAVMGHILAAQLVWYGRMSGESAPVSIWEDIPVSWMRETAERQYRQLASYLETFSDDELRQPIAYKNSKGQEFQNSRLDILTHLSHHAAYHRGQVVQLIRPLLTEAPVTDYIVWVRDGRPLP